jgi:AraC family transcriptional regulator
MLMNSPRTNVAPLFDRNIPRLLQPAMLQPMQGGSSPRRRPDGHRNHQAGQLYDRHTAERIDPAVEISPDDIVKRRAVTWDGMAAEIVQATRHGRIELRFRAPHHLLAVYEQGVRGDGETFVEGLPRSTLRDFKRKFTFVPAGHEYYEWHELRSPARVVYFNFDPAKMPDAF